MTLPLLHHQYPKPLLCALRIDVFFGIIKRVKSFPSEILPTQISVVENLDLVVGELRSRFRWLTHVEGLLNDLQQNASKTTYPIREHSRNI